MSAVAPAEFSNAGNGKRYKHIFTNGGLLGCFPSKRGKKSVPSRLYVKPQHESPVVKRTNKQRTSIEETKNSHKVRGVKAGIEQRTDVESDNDKVNFRLLSKKFHCFPQICPSTIIPQSLWYLSWLGLVTVCYLYNILTIVLRTAFQPEGYYSKSNYYIWMSVDYLCDIVYLIDLAVIKPRVQFIRNGLLQTSARDTMRNYVRSSGFKFDLLSLLPLDLFYIYTGVFNAAPLLRLPRYLKLKTAWEFFDRCDQRAKSGYVVRVIRTMLYMLYLIHVETCGYYAISYYEGIGSNQWVFQGEGIAYIRCFYLATKTATSIGNNPKPTNQLEYMFMTAYWLSGVFVFALLIGQIRDIFESANSVKSNYQKAQDSTLQYLQNLNVPKRVQNKVRDWFNYNWEQQKTLNENLLVDVLPTKMKTDLFLSVHIDTLEHVSLFKNVDRSLLSDLILKLIPVIFLPGDIICHKGDVGTEMYIVMHGEVEVITDDGVTLATLSKGHVFGEISLMGLAGGNRRTANVRSKGYSNLFVLSKYDFDGAMQDYPAAYAQLRMRAQKLLTKKPTKQKGNENQPSVKAISEASPKQLDLFSSTVQKSRLTQIFTVSDGTEKQQVDNHTAERGGFSESSREISTLPATAKEASTSIEQDSYSEWVLDTASSTLSHSPMEHVLTPVSIEGPPLSCPESAKPKRSISSESSSVKLQDTAV